MRLNGRVALVTGSGAAIGRAISELFANEGTKVALNYHHSRDSCIRATVPFLREHPRASVINVVSASAITGEGSSIVYAASKAGMLTMTKSLAPQIRVNAISPGFIRTHFADRQESDPVFERDEKATPLQELATVEDCAAAALFLAADAAAITGQMILVEGGLIVLGPVRSLATRTDHDA